MSTRPVVGYLKIDGIPGSAIKKGFEQEITVFGYEHSIVRAMDKMHDGTYIPERAQGALGVPLGNSREAHRPFVVIKGMDRATVLLIQALDTNKVFKDPIVLSIIQSVQTGELVAMRISLKQAVVQGITYSEMGGEGSLERVNFAYSEIEWTYEGPGTMTEVPPNRAGVVVDTRDPAVAELVSFSGTLSVRVTDLFGRTATASRELSGAPRRRIPGQLPRWIFGFERLLPPPRPADLVARLASLVRVLRTVRFL